MIQWSQSEPVEWAQNCERLWRNNIPCCKSDVQLLAEGRNQVPWNWWKSDKMAATKRSYFLSMLRSGFEWKFPRNQEKPSTQAINEHAPWESQSLGIKAASNDALPLTPNQTSPCTHRSYHFGIRLHCFLCLASDLWFLPTGRWVSRAELSTIEKYR